MRQVDRKRLLFMIVIIIGLIILFPNPFISYYNMVYITEYSDVNWIYYTPFGQSYSEGFEHEIPLLVFLGQNKLEIYHVLPGISLIVGVILLTASLISSYILKIKLDRTRNLVKHTGYLGSIVLLFSPMLFFLLLNIDLVYKASEIYITSSGGYGNPLSAEEIGWGFLNYFFGYKEVMSIGYYSTKIADLYWFCGAGFYLMIVGAIMGFAGTTTMIKHLDQAKQYVQNIVPRRTP
ncbi:MAG: hypothetical protein ACFFCS_22815 [Candidatus Hodarchaeota archaeon]